MGKNIKWLVIGLVAILAFFVVKSCGGPDEKYWIKKALYDQAVKDAAAQHVTDMGTIVTQEGTIAAKDAAIAERDKSIGVKNAQVNALKATLHDLQAAEPSQPELETQPLVINLRAQIGNLTRMVSIGAEVIENKDGIIADWSAKFDAQVTISETWKRAYETEHRLRLLSEDLNKSLEHQGKVSRLYGKVSMAALAGAGVYILATSLGK
jgi:uncharacterized coiled-coil protein SlyX